MLTAAVIAPIVFLATSKLEPVEARLRSALRSSKGVVFNLDEDTLTVKYRTHDVKIPRPAKNRTRHLAEQVEAEQPTLSGFKLEVNTFSHLKGEPPRPTQAVRMNPNWVRDYGAFKMDAEDRQIDGSDSALHYRIEWGNSFNPTLLSKIREALKQGSHPIEH